LGSILQVYPATLCLWTLISNVICGGLFLCSVDIGEIDDHHCLSFLFIMHNYKLYMNDLEM